jgi:membrane associated rhomboid family serine protease
MYFRIKIEYMKAIKQYVSSLPIGVKYLVSINLLVYVLTLATYYFASINLTNYLGAYPTYSEYFNPLAIITSGFTHSINFTHILFNMILFLIFAPSVEVKFGTRNMFLIYVLCGIVGYTTTNYAYYQNKQKIEQSLSALHIKPSTIEIKDHRVSQEYLSTLDESDIVIVREYNRVISKTCGASSALYGIIAIYLLLNLTSLKKISFNLLATYCIGFTLFSIFKNTNILDGSDYAHIGGFTTGLIFLLIKKASQK